MRTLPVLTPEQSRAWDAAAVQSGRPLRVLMEQAGRGVAQLALDRFAVAARQGVLVACGPGNNGGDGWVAARALHVLGVPVWVSEAAPPVPGSLADDVRAVALADGVRTVPADGPWPGVGLAIDALLGTGASGRLRGSIAPLAARLTDLHRPIVAIDGPTGLDLGTGIEHGALHADMTVTFGGVRRGHLLARDQVGDVVVIDIGFAAPLPEWPKLVDLPWAAARLDPLPARSHKGSRGRVVIVGGAPSMLGAARMASRSAFAAGAGLVHVVAPEESIRLMRQAEPDVQTLAHDFTTPIAPSLEELLRRADAVVVGPGLGRAPERTAFVLAVLATARAAVIDADALIALREARPDLERLAAGRPLVCTPHVGEFHALFPDCAIDLETAPWEAAAAAAHTSGATVLLKGVPTVVACPDRALLTVAAGNPGLATGGSGDVLSGIIGTLLAQGIALPDAAALGAQALGDAADHAARRVTARSMRPMDVVQALPDVWRLWHRARDSMAPVHPVLAELPRPRSV